MGTIIYFEEDPGRDGVIRFVNEYRGKRWYRKERIKYSLSCIDANPFVDESLMDEVCNRVKRDYPESKIYRTTFDEFEHSFIDNKFWVIARHGQDCEVLDYFSLLEKGVCVWTKDIQDILVILDEESAKDSVDVFRSYSNSDRILARPVYLNMKNKLLLRNFMIICVRKDNEDSPRYFKKIDKYNRVQTVATSNYARKFSYRSALSTYEYLRMNNKRYEYAVIPALNDNVHGDAFASYIKSHNIPRMVQMDFKLKMLNGK